MYIHIKIESEVKSLPNNTIEGKSNGKKCITYQHYLQESWSGHINIKINLRQGVLPEEYRDAL